ncbi:hypothetical protein BBO99_00002908 [Phytophthora kernoviae]|uniref:FYVE-type domain-containing protein n=2 Tax=Phytophthora kernoviae TaxID=325452 RepID=A0A3R7IN14_9STRA|nr:hypothetical protein G195_004538 [Phytophthora kernoviae 00238/432]KAG2523810.1 hypothetical protein JM16_002318 [Phytophthora kernoviae]KAG2525631.1 hypothetical protein JM18_002384 [Phytophthora kernoviae]RLN38155.1 hypothetical protein BBI17_002900 [Phytophthora kernoviae]RLN82444.1 hypothetical protein BBO99_00002908 [Phytophthora kernoviae]
MNDEHAGDAPDWMQEQAAEYQDLVGSFVESVVDSDTDEILEYQLIWEGGDLGVALTTIEGGDGGVAVSRVTGKGFPFGIKNVGPGDLLLAINMKDTTKLTLDDVVAYLQVCDLPATLRFKKLSPVADSAPVSVPRKSTYVITSDNNGPTKFDDEPVQEHYASPTSISPQKSHKEPEPKPADVAPSPVLDKESPSHKLHEPKPSSPRQSVAPEEKLRELDGLVLTSGVNDLGFEDSESERDSRDSWREESFDVDANIGWKGDEEEKETEKPSKATKTDQAKLRFTREKSNSTVPMLGHFSVETKPDAVPILPEVEEATGIAAIDNVDDFSSVDHHKSPGGEAGRVRPSDMSAAPSSMVSSLNSSMNTDAPRGSVRVTMDSTAPIMKSHPIGTLHEMCTKGNLRGVIQHLRVDGPEALLNREPNHGQTGLHLAVKSGKVPLVKVILEQYKPVEDIINVEDDKGNTALHFAATKTPAMVHLLLESGASANVKNSRKYTPLIISVITSRDDKVIIPRMLLKFGANPNDMHDSQTVIHTAIGNGLLQIAGALVRAGAKMDVEDADGKNVFEKLNRKSLRVLISHIYFPPTHITEKERTECMLCHTKFKFGHRKHNCTHCGRLCCAECSALTVDMVKFPLGFPGRTRRGAANHDQKRVCKTCFNVFKEREDKPEEHNMSRFINRVINIEWDEVNPEKLQTVQDAGRRGEK